MSAPVELVALADLQAWLGQNGDADILAALIARVSRTILSYLGRPDILPCVYDEIRDGDGGALLPLRHWPALEIEALEVDGRALPAAAAPLEDGWRLERAEAAPPGRMQAVFLRGARFRKGLGNVRIRYVAGYRAQDEAAIPAAPGPYTLCARQPWGAWMQDAGVRAADGAILTGGAAPAPGVYAVAGGVYSFDASDAGRTVALRYGYVPSDLAQAALEWTADRYSARNRIGQRSKSLGGQESVAFDLSPVPGFVAALLQPYRRTSWPC